MNTVRNRVQLIGNLGSTPELKDLENGNKVARFSVATSEDYINRKGEKISATHWHNIVAWGKLAGLAAQKLKKGVQVTIDGKLSSRSYVAKDGSKRYVTEVVVQELVLNEKN
jgi:single-strand DNA-binding protein